MTYQIHKNSLNETLREYERVTGTGNMKQANLAMAKIIRSLVSMIENIPAKPCSNCECGTKPILPMVPKLNQIEFVAPEEILTKSVALEPQSVVNEPPTLHGQPEQSEDDVELDDDTKEDTKVRIKRNKK